MRTAKPAKLSRAIKFNDAMRRAPRVPPPPTDKRPSAQYGERSRGRVKKLPLFRFAAALVEWLVRKLAYELTVFNSTTARFHFFGGFGADHLFTGSSESCRGCEQGWPRTILKLRVSFNSPTFEATYRR
jgi:hypothetical protein